MDAVVTRWSNQINQNRH